MCCNPGFATLFGYEKDSDIIDSSISSLIPSIIKPNPSTNEQVMNIIIKESILSL